MFLGSLGLLAGLAAVLPGCVSKAIAAAIVVMIAGGIVASTWHGIAYAELATIAGARHVATALGLGNTFAFGTYFLTPLAIPLVLDVWAWKGVWLVAATAAGLGFALFPSAAADAKTVGAV